MRYGVDDQISAFPLARDAGIGLVNRELFRTLPSGAAPDDAVIWYSNVRSARAATNRLLLRPTSWSTASSLVRVAWQQCALPFALRRDRVDVLLGTAFVAPVLATCPTVLVVHDLYFLRKPEAYRGGLRAKYLAWLTRHSCRRAGRVVCSSAATRKDLLALVPGLKEERVIVSHLGFDSEAWEGQVARAEGMGPQLSKPYVLFTGTLEPKKNVSFLLDCFDASPWLRENLQLVLVGKNGWGGETLEKRIAEKPWVCRTGYLSQEDLYAYYRNALCLALPSLGEGFGYPVLEAMASSVPVLASDRGSLPEVCGTAGLVLPLEGHAWVEAFRAVLHNEETREALIEAGRRRARDFEWARYVNDLWESARQVHDEA